MNLPDCVTVLPDFLTGSEAASLFDALMQEVAWRQTHVRMYGKSIPVPRLIAWYGDPGANYTYSGIENVSQM